VLTRTAPLAKINKFEYMLKIIKALQEIPDRYIKEKEARNTILNELKKLGIDCNIDYYFVEVPQYGKYYLDVDGEKVDCKPCGLRSGKIKSRLTLLEINDYEGGSAKGIIYYNKYCGSVSVHSFFKHPAFSIKYDDRKKIERTKYIDAFLEVKRKKIRCANILIGNRRNPQNIIFCHYDSIGPGAVDNASGIGVSIELAKKYRSDSLFVLSGNEEISYDYPVYWGKGYRMFEKKYLGVMDKTKSILIVDSVGIGTPKVYDRKDYQILKLAFPIRNLRRYAGKTRLISSEYKNIMSIYHSDDDNLGAVKQNDLKKAFLLASKAVV